jgi:hypothetical protein
MKLLLLATKSPWPPVDGGRLLLLHTLEGLAAAGVRPTLVAPVDPRRFDLVRVARELSAWCEPRLVPAALNPPVTALIRSGLEGLPLGLARHAIQAVRQEVARLVSAERFDLVHAEQLQAFPQAAAAARGIPVVLRAENVESDLWTANASLAGWPVRPLLAVEAARLARHEGRAVEKAAATLALSAEDAARLSLLAGSRGKVRVIRAPFPGELPAGQERLSGEPAVVLMGSRGWRPNEDAVAWFLAEVWPVVLNSLPGAVLHLFGPTPPGGPPPSARIHPSPADSVDAFAPGSVLVVPLRVASGVRMKVLEAWARGVPVIGTPAALSGLEVREGEEALTAADPMAFSEVLARLHLEPGLAGRIVEGGRRALAERHDPGRSTAALVAAYREALG